MNETWTVPGDGKATFDNVIDTLNKRGVDNGKVYVGTDSQMCGKYCVFSTAIVLYDENKHKGGYYFYRTRRFPRDDFKQLAHRITTEVQHSVELSCKMLEIVPDVNIEIHIDSSPAANGTKTSKFSDGLVGYAVGMGFNAKIKPEAWAASTIADKHAK
jgi:uncharacterized protein